MPRMINEVKGSEDFSWDKIMENSEDNIHDVPLEPKTGDTLPIAEPVPLGNNVKQVIVVRRDLNMRTGKIAAQAAHAASMFLLSRLYREFLNSGTITLSEEEWAWTGEDHGNGHIAKIVCYVNSEAELLDLAEKAKKEGLETHVIVDSGKTEFHGIATTTCIAIGPDLIERIDKVTKDLPLL